MTTCSCELLPIESEAVTLSAFPWTNEGSRASPLSGWQSAHHLDDME